jgi:excisionase family DNA binding protein
MREHENPVYSPAPEDIRERTIIQNGKNFEPLLDTGEAARLLRMHPRTLRTKARKGTIPGVQVGKRWRFRASTLDRWLGQLAS